MTILNFTKEKNTPSFDEDNKLNPQNKIQNFFYRFM